MADTILSIRRVGQETAFEPVRREGLSNFETRVMDTQALDLPSDSFDAGISRFALMLVPDIDEAHPNSALPKLSVGFNNNRAAKAERKGVEKRHMVMHLAQKGHSIKEIAEQLQIPTGEIDLILNLNQSRRTQVTA